MSATDFCRTVSDHLTVQSQVFVRAGVEGYRIQNTEYRIQNTVGEFKNDSNGNRLSNFWDKMPMNAM